MGARARRAAALHRPGQADPERALKELLWAAAGRMPQRALCSSGSVTRVRSWRSGAGGTAGLVRTAWLATSPPVEFARREHGSGGAAGRRRTLIVRGPNNGGR